MKLQIFTSHYFGTQIVTSFNIKFVFIPKQKDRGGGGLHFDYFLSINNRGINDHVRSRSDRGLRSI